VENPPTYNAFYPLEFVGFGPLCLQEFSQLFGKRKGSTFIVFGGPRIESNCLSLEIDLSPLNLTHFHAGGAAMGMVWMLKGKLLIFLGKAHSFKMSQSIRFSNSKKEGDMRKNRFLEPAIQELASRIFI